MWPQNLSADSHPETLVADRQENRPDVEKQLEQVIELLHRHELVENLVHRQESPRQELVETLVHRQHLGALQQLLDGLDRKSVV